MRTIGARPGRAEDGLGGGAAVRGANGASGWELELASCVQLCCGCERGASASDADSNAGAVPTEARVSDRSCGHVGSFDHLLMCANVCERCGARAEAAW